MKFKFFRPFFVLGMGIMFLTSLFIDIPGIEVAIAIFTALTLFSYLPYLSRVPLTVVIILNVTALILYIIGGTVDDVIEGLLMNTAVLMIRSEEHTAELQSRGHLVWRLRLDEKKAATSVS